MKVRALRELMIRLDSTDVPDDAEVLISGGPDHSYLCAEWAGVRVVEKWGRGKFSQADGEPDGADLDAQKTNAVPRLEKALVFAA